MICYFKAADVCWTTPLRDGLNLVAKEYIVSKQGDPGALVLSEFVGAAVELPESILTNPYSIKRMDDAIDLALAMPEDQKKETMEKMYKTVTEYDVKRWADHLFEAFQQIQSKGSMDADAVEPETPSAVVG